VLSRSGSEAARGLGRAILAATPWLMKGLSVAGTAAMFLVGGGILTHGVPALHHLMDQALQHFDGFARTIGSLLLNGLAGFVAGLLVLAALTLIRRVHRGR
jgi:predicted DNA repair protein MutK